MRVFISVDMEGVAGIVHSDQTLPHTPEYAQSCRLMTGEANAAVEGALAAGATEVVVSDAHWDMRNIIPDELHPAAELLQGSPRPWSMMHGLDDRFDALCLVGCHARAGTTAAVIDHTYSPAVFDVRLNDQPVGEIGLNAAFAGYHGVPVVLVTGDNTAVAEAQALLGDHVVGVAVKQGLARGAARALAPTVARNRIRAAMIETLQRKHEPYRLTGPITLSVEFMRAGQADIAGMLPGAERVGARTVAFTHDDYLMVFRAWRTLFILGNAE